MTSNTCSIGPQSTMRAILEAYPGAQRALFRRYHVGGCASCGFQPEETLEAVCHRNGVENADEALELIRASHDQDARILIEPLELAAWRQRDQTVRLIDVRSREEYEAVHIAGSALMSQPVIQEILAEGINSRPLVIIDHHGKQGLDAAAYFSGHGLTDVRCLRGGIDAWSIEVDPKLPRYRLG